MNMNISDDISPLEEMLLNEYMIDDSLDSISRLAKYYNSDFSLQRQALVRDLLSTCESAGYSESVKVVIPLLSQFSMDLEPMVRRTLVECLPGLAKYFVENGGDEGYELLLQTFIPMGFDLLVDKNIEVETHALQSIQVMGDLVRTEDVETHLLGVVVRLAHDERAEDYRVAAVQLFNRLAPKFGPTFCAEQVIPELELLSSDSSFSVRRIVAKLLGGVAQAVTSVPAAQESIISLFSTLCDDETWGVRQMCPEAVEQVSLSVSNELRLGKLLPMYQSLLEDSIRWVRSRAYEYLGQFIHTLHTEEISPDLLQTFVSLAFPPEVGDAQNSAFCAFSFPAVLEAVGRERWGSLRDAYATLVKDVQWKVRRSLAYSLHEVAQLLGTKLTEEFLVPVFHILLRDLDGVKLGVVLSADKFLEIVTPSSRDNLVPLLCRVPIDSNIWRPRFEVAKRIGNIGLLLSSGSLAYGPVISMVLRLLEDSVAAVRQATYKPAAVLLKHLSDNKENEYNSFLTSIVDLASAPSYQPRQMYAYIVQCAAEIEADYVIQSSLLDGLLTISQDPVPNVRNTVEKVLEKTFLTSAKWQAQPKIVQCVNLIKKHKLSNADSL